jgi:hypothetical protein
MSHLTYNDLSPDLRLSLETALITSLPKMSNARNFSMAMDGLAAMRPLYADLSVELRVTLEGVLEAMLSSGAMGGHGLANSLFALVVFILTHLNCIYVRVLRR